MSPSLNDILKILLGEGGDGLDYWPQTMGKPANGKHRGVVRLYERGDANGEAQLVPPPDEYAEIVRKLGFDGGVSWWDFKMSRMVASGVTFFVSLSKGYRPGMAVRLQTLFGYFPDIYHHSLSGDTF